MKKSRLLSLTTLGVLWLGVGIACQKDPPEPASCSNGTCCMEDMRPYDYVETIANAPADLLERTLIFKNPLPTGSKFHATALGTCSLSDSKVDGLKATYPSDGSPGPYHYRVWGKVYRDRDAQPVVAVPVMYVFIDRIEEAK